MTHSVVSAHLSKLEVKMILIQLKHRMHSKFAPVSIECQSSPVTRWTVLVQGKWNSNFNQANKSALLFKTAILNVKCLRQLKNFTNSTQIECHLSKMKYSTIWVAAVILVVPQCKNDEKLNSESYSEADSATYNLCISNLCWINISSLAIAEIEGNLQNKMGAVILRLVLSSCLLLLLSLQLVSFPKRYMIFIVGLNTLSYSDSFTQFRLTF